MDDLSNVDVAGFSRASQMAASEFTQILADLTQANYPVTTGLMPWSFTVPWPIEFFMFVDGLEQPTSSYYTLKRCRAHTRCGGLPELVWAKGEKVPIRISAVDAPPTGLAALTVSVQILDPQFHSVWEQKRQMDVPPGPSARGWELGEFTIPDSLEDKFFFVVAEAKEAEGKLLSRSVYWPRSLKLMNDPDFRAQVSRFAPTLL